MSDCSSACLWMLIPILNSHLHPSSRWKLQWGTSALHLPPPSVWFKSWKKWVQRICISWKAGNESASPRMKHNICRECRKTLDYFPLALSADTLRGEWRRWHRRRLRREWFCPVWWSTARACPSTPFRCSDLWIVMKRSATRMIGPYCSKLPPYLSKFQIFLWMRKILHFLLKLKCDPIYIS
jgi:hypothetical protein